MQNNSSLWTGTATGTLLSVLPNLQSEDIARTVILATIGAIVSFLVSVVIKLLRKVTKKINF